ncbi:MAG: YggT family protein [Cyanobacteriota bacterium]|nr:YggT family protein [Cyanobacteriota bacterium]
MQEQDRPPEPNQEPNRKPDREITNEIRASEERLRLQEEERHLAEVQKQAVLAKMIQGIYYLVGALELLLSLRFVLCLTGANPDNQVANAIYTLSYPFYTPFSTLFGSPECGAGVSVFDVNLLVAMAVYSLLTWLVVKLLRLIWS